MKEIRITLRLEDDEFHAGNIELCKQALELLWKIKGLETVDLVLSTKPHPKAYQFELLRRSCGFARLFTSNGDEMGVLLYYRTFAWFRDNVPSEYCYVRLEV
jgi:hypothetical protein